MTRNNKKRYNKKIKPTPPHFTLEIQNSTLGQSTSIPTNLKAKEQNGQSSPGRND